MGRRKRKRKSVSLLCECGCGEFANEGKRFIWGHHTKTSEARKKRSESNKARKWKRKSVSLFCECSCGEFAKEGKKFLPGHCNKTSEARKRNSKNNKGKLNPRYGVKVTKETKRKMSESRKGEQNPFYGRKHTEEAKKRFTRKGTKATRETCRKMRISALDYISRQYAEGGQIQPRYNFNSCKFFEQMDKDFDTQGQYATNGGEFSLWKELGYAGIDYINFDLKLIIEWDEDRHYDADGNLREDDVQRQKDIQERFPDFLFLRIRERGFQKDDFYDDLRSLKERKLFIEGG